MLVSTNKPTAESRYHNHDPLVWLLGHANKAKFVVDGLEAMTLVDAESQISALTEGFSTEMGLMILPLRNLIGGVLHLKGMGGILIPYIGYIEANLTIPDLPQYNEDALFLAIWDHKYAERLSVQIDSEAIHHLVVTVTEKELQQAGQTWKQVHFSTVISKRNTVKGLNVSEYDLKGVKDKINTIR